jgi:hypothetical protein
MRLILALGVALMTSSLALSSEFPSPVVPDGLGVNIHFTGEPARDLDMIQADGFKFIRMDFAWQSIEKEKGVYDFAPYDELTAALAKRGIRALYILDYGNPLYETDQSVRTEEGRQAFARFAATAAERYRAKGIIWELWNEPNIGFWKPQPSVDDYMKLAKAVFPAIREADPGALRVAPATSGVPLDFLEQCFRRGLLELVDGVTVHPYRQDPPETAAADYLRLRALIARYRPDATLRSSGASSSLRSRSYYGGVGSLRSTSRPDLPILSGEWGYSSVWKGFDPELQGRYLARHFLTNLSMGVPLSIWYDWHDDGQDPKEPEHHFGTVAFDYQPKPAYLEMQRLVGALRGMSFVKRLQSAAQDYLLLFSDGKRYAIAAWTTGDAHEAEPIPGRKVVLSGDPQYLPVPPEAKAVLAEGAWTVAPRLTGWGGDGTAGQPLALSFEVRVRNPFAQAAKVRLSGPAAAGLKGRFAGPSSFELAPGEQRTLLWRGRVNLRYSGEFAVTFAADIAGLRGEQRVEFPIISPILTLAAQVRDKALHPRELVCYLPIEWRFSRTAAAGWEQPGFDDSGWMTVRTDSQWYTQAGLGDMTGDGWARVWFEAPDPLPDRPLFLLVGALDEAGGLYLNGNPLYRRRSQTPGAWREPFVAEVTGKLKGGRNLLAVHATAESTLGGVWQPCAVVALPDAG